MIGVLLKNSQGCCEMSTNACATSKPFGGVASVSQIVTIPSICHHDIEVNFEQKSLVNNIFVFGRNVSHLL